MFRPQRFLNEANSNIVTADPSDMDVTGLPSDRLNGNSFPEQFRPAAYLLRAIVT